MLADLRLYQLISPSLPVGAFTYSQGLEWAIEKGWVTDPQTLSLWLSNQMMNSLATLELPVLRKIRWLLADGQTEEAQQWCDFVVASRETKELRMEEKQRGHAFAQLLPQIGIELESATRAMVSQTQIAAYALASLKWDIPPTQLCGAYVWGWLENAVTTGVKLIPLGQSAGQKLLIELSDQIPMAVKKAAEWPEDDIGSFTPAQVIASSRHETQYTRLFRS